jgi:hypothetical protein
MNTLEELEQTVFDHKHELQELERALAVIEINQTATVLAILRKNLELQDAEIAFEIAKAQ